MAGKSLCLTYFFWLIGGIFGLHHFYLGRDRHAFVYWITFGGYLLGWVRDLWKIPTYVKDVNMDEEYLKWLTYEMRQKPKPPRSFFRIIGFFVVGQTMGYVVFYALPVKQIEATYLPFALCMVPFAVAVGVHLVGNIGREKGKLLLPLLTAYSTYPLYFFNPHSISITVVATVYTYEKFCGEWQRTDTYHKSFCRRVFTLAFSITIYVCLLSSGFYFNCTITTEAGEEVRCVDATKHFFNSPIWQEFTEVMKSLWEYGKQHGWRELWYQLLNTFDPHGYKHALKVFDLTEEATEAEISKRYRELSRKYHPDRFKTFEERKVAEEKFIEINKAYETLSKIKALRMAKNIKNCDSEQCDEKTE